jgi:hypothetical protein
LAAAAAAAATGGSSGAGAEPPGAGQPPPPPPLLMDVNRHLEGAPAAVVDSLAVLEWPAVCRQVACFCGTPMGAELLAGGGLPLGGSAAESEALLQETEEAGAAGLAVAGVFDLRPALAAVALGGCLNAKQLEGVAVSLEASFAASDAARAADGAGRPRFPSLAAKEASRARARRGRARRHSNLRPGAPQLFSGFYSIFSRFAASLAAAAPAAALPFEHAARRSLPSSSPSPPAVRLCGGRRERRAARHAAEAARQPAGAARRRDAVGAHAGGAGRQRHARAGAHARAVRACPERRRA